MSSITPIHSAGPPPSRVATGTPRPRTQRHPPAAVRTRNSTAAGCPAARAAVQAATVAARSSGWTAASQPVPWISALVWPVSASQPLPSSIPPPASLRQMASAPVSARARKRCSLAASPAVARSRAAASAATDRAEFVRLPQHHAGGGRPGPRGEAEFPAEAAGQDRGQRAADHQEDPASATTWSTAPPSGAWSTAWGTAMATA
jgi:hypothetical protein